MKKLVIICIVVIYIWRPSYHIMAQIITEANPMIFVEGITIVDGAINIQPLLATLYSAKMFFGNWPRIGNFNTGNLLRCEDALTFYKNFFSIIRLNT